MLKLFIDTATAKGSIALYENNELRGQTIFNDRLRHLKVLHYEIDKLLNLNKKKINDINLIGVDIGPGSFTGIRIGVTTARTLSQLINCYIEGITSLDLLKEKINADNIYICPLFDAKKNRVFTTLFLAEKRVVDYMDISVQKLVHIIKNIVKEKNIIFLGDGLLRYKNDLLKEFPKAIFKDEQFYYPEALYMNSIITRLQKYNNEYENIIPFYLRKSDAEESVKKD